MKFKNIAYTTLTAALFAAGAAHAGAITVEGGAVDFTGEVVDPACTAVASTPTVMLDPVSSTLLQDPGQPAGQQKIFSITLQNCSTGVLNNVGITFNGDTDGTLPDALKNTAGAGAATHVALQLYGPDGQTLALGSDSSTISVQDAGDTTIPFKVDYIATDAAATAGSVAATATFNINYS
ncbi:fimbrial protein [Scandinavium sp. H11S7]|uniref:Fimbrial protein n=1 Tax=Scandinavium hiltneri TaxID=2926519 RepID=A0ABT2DXP8_9ENTR|nr:fimbrial protein [Scandinavium hiltneri]MCS2160402.1 fimbrial protein [Scandinavium hiltneri]